MQHDLITLLADRILCDKPLSQADMDRFNIILLNELFDCKLSHKKVKLQVRRFRQGMNTFITLVDNELKLMERSAHSFLDSKRKEIERIKSLPAFAESFDPPELVMFIRSLEKPRYSFAAAEKLVGVSRQTLRKYADNKQYSLKIHNEGRSAYLLTADIISFYRAKHYKNYETF